MKVLMFAVREDEYPFVEKFKHFYQLDVTIEKRNLSLQTVHLTKSFDAVIVIGTCDLSKAVLQQLALNGVKVVCSRSAGFDNFDMAYLKDSALFASNVPAYSPNAISEFTITAALCLARKIKTVIHRVAKQNFSLKSLIGFEIRKSTIGVIGTGRIGQESAKAFKALGGNVIGYDAFENAAFKEYGEYVSLDRLFEISDIITLHVPYLESTHHLICSETIQKMKKHVLIINTARGGIVNTKDVLTALENGDIGGFAMDVYENEHGLFHHDLSQQPIEDTVLLKLMQREDCLVTPHIAFYSDEAVSNMVEVAMKNVFEFKKNGNVLHSIK